MAQQVGTDGAGPFRSGVVALVGPPNAGKSTLLNALLGEKLAIVAPRPQTTRRILRGVLPLEGAQAVLVDTPGLLEGANPLEWGMRREALAAARDADVVLALACPRTRSAWEAPGAPRLPWGRTVVLATKADLGPEGAAGEWARELAERLGASGHLAVSARRRRGLEDLKALLRARLPEGPPLLPLDGLTDAPMKDLAGEVVREQALLACRDEVPHSLAVGVERYVERPDGLHEIHAVLTVERESQKAIVIGRAGARLKLIGSRARVQLERLAGAKVFLGLWVKVRKDWKKDTHFLEELGYPSAKGPHGRKTD